NSHSESRLRLRARFRDATREAILTAAASVFAADGATNARMEDIASTANVAVDTMYNYFADRTALVRALLDMRTRALLDALDAPPGDRADRSDRAGRGFAGDLERFVASLARHFDANRALLSVLLEKELHRGIDAQAASRRHTVLQKMLIRAEQ